MTLDGYLEIVGRCTIFSLGVLLFFSITAILLGVMLTCLGVLK